MSSNCICLTKKYVTTEWEKAAESRQSTKPHFITTQLSHVFKGRLVTYAVQELFSLHRCTNSDKKVWLFTAFYFYSRTM